MTTAEQLRAPSGGADHSAPPRGSLSARELVALGVVATLVTWLPHAFGGRGPGAASLSCLAVAGALVVARPWRWTGSLLLGLLTWLSLAALLVVPLTSGGRDATVAAATYGLSAGAYLLARTLARREEAAVALAAAVTVGGLLQFGWAFLPWWGSGDPAHGMVGTYYWKNQFAAALLAPAVLGLALVLLDRRPWRFVGWVTAPLAVTGVFLSASRAALGLLVVGWLATGIVLARQGLGWRVAARRWGAVTLLSVMVAFVLPGPPFFTQQRSPLSQTVATTADGHLQSSGSYRLQVWTEALHVLAGHPVAGAGYGQVGSAAEVWRPAGWPVSSLVHNGMLQGLADGGLLLGLPLLLGIGLAGVAMLRRTVPGARTARRPLTAVAAIAGLLLVAHAMVDFDWSYPALAVITAVVVGLATPAGERKGAGEGSGPARHLPMSLTALLVVSLVVGGMASWGQAFHINTFVPHSSQGAGE